jgi:hypothetical protein
MEITRPRVYIPRSLDPESQDAIVGFVRNLSVESALFLATGDFPGATSAVRGSARMARP